MINLVEPPDLLLYLRADLPRLIRQIEQRAPRLREQPQH